MEALALMLIHLLTPRGLSWTRNGVPKTDEAHERLKLAKKNALPEDLCRGLPPEFEEFLRYCRRLNFYDKPDYERWIEEFRSLAVESGFPEEDDFIWPPPEPIVRGSVIYHRLAIDKNSPKSLNPRPRNWTSRPFLMFSEA
jgi:casein kinase 1